MNLRELQLDPRAFRAALRVSTDDGTKSFADAMDDWQRADFEALDDGWRRAVFGPSVDAKHQRGWLERGRGHSKSTDLGVMAAWALFAAKTPIEGVAAAADQDQARLLRDAIRRIVVANPWLEPILEVQKNVVTNRHTGSKLTILASDAASSYGLLVDFIIADEVSNWPNDEMWNSLVSTAAKKSTCVLVCITNAGLADTWQEKTRDLIADDADWYFNRLDGPVASWVSPKLLDEQRRLLPGPAYERLWLNRWGTGGGDALTPDAIEAAFDHELVPMYYDDGYVYVAGLDLGLTRDSSALVVLAVTPGESGKRSIRLAHVRVWRPEDHGGKVDLVAVEKHVRLTHDRLPLEKFGFDPYQCEHLAQTLELSIDDVTNRDSDEWDDPWLAPAPATAANLRQQASTLIECFQDRRLWLYPCDELRRDLRKLRVVEKSYGFRLESPRDATGHGDVASAFAIALPLAHELAASVEDGFAVPF